MSEQANVAQVPNRNKKVSMADFVAGYKKGCSDGKSADEIAKTCFPTEMNVGSMNARASGIRTEAKDAGLYFPSPVGGGGGGLTKEQKQKAKIDLLTSLLDPLDIPGETEDDESVE